MQRRKYTDKMEKQGLAARLFFINFFMKLNVVCGFEKV